MGGEREQVLMCTVCGFDGRSINVPRPRCPLLRSCLWPLGLPLPLSLCLSASPARSSTLESLIAPTRFEGTVDSGPSGGLFLDD